MRISSTIKFRASHAVASDPEFREHHPHDWKLRATVEGPMVGPGWVIPWAALRSVMHQAVPGFGETLNDWYGYPDATNERLVEAQFETIARELPDGITLISCTLVEDETNEAHWP